MWDFLELVLLKMGFSERWTGWMVEFNGSATNEFRLFRGLRQGDPLSPFLFIVEAEELRIIEGFKNVILGHSVSHLQSNEVVVRNTKYILCCFEIFSGLNINFQKSCLVGFSTKEEFVYRMAAVYKCKIGEFSFNYLGIPLGADRRKISSWNGIVERVEKKLVGWKSRTLSWAGRVVLINDVLSNLPIYFMSIFQAPITGSVGGRRKMARISWNQICLPKVKGGTGVVDLRVKNKSLLAKWCWRFAVDREALWRKLIAAKYGNPVQFWKCIVENAKDSTVARWTGIESFRWLDVWCRDRPLRVEFQRLFHLVLNKKGKVIDFSTSNEREVQMVSSLKEAMSCRILFPEVEDRLLWKHDNKGVFSVIKLTELLLTVGKVDMCNDFDKIWKLKVPPRVRSFLWMISIDRLPTKVFLIRRGMKLNRLRDGCPWCYSDQETAVHLFFPCNFIVSFWRKILDWWEVKWRPFQGFSDFFIFCKNVAYTGVIKSLWMISVSACWSVWLARNELVFDKKWSKMSNLVFLSKTSGVDVD
ncbi:hypothetical protein ES288_A13G084000v1 [Gossypium darwinii]|uniref:Reverse transcriptase zinc-binding domain-containing protein n=1 Tax=Gossypium darwinii TaxID=34276 RepID=A0A5D2DXJ7_GOSDA|nr:hypothetical protein ES288_A13G084000v1 [Gossypium darwinii]